MINICWAFSQLEVRSLVTITSTALPLLCVREINKRVNEWVDTEKKRVVVLFFSLNTCKRSETILGGRGDFQKSKSESEAEKSGSWGNSLTVIRHILKRPNRVYRAFNSLYLRPSFIKFCEIIMNRFLFFTLLIVAASKYRDWILNFHSWNVFLPLKFCFKNHELILN